MQSNDTILAGIEPGIATQLISRRDVIRRGAAVSSTVAAGLAMGSVPLALAALSREAYGQSAPLTVQQVLDFALMLEIFENEFYKAVLGISASAAQNTAFSTVRALAPAAVVTSLQQIQKHEAAHVSYLLAAGAVNTLDLSATSFDFTGNRGAGTPGPFVRATTELQFLLLVAQMAEDTGVRAYKGQATALQSDTVVLESALRIHSVEARHAAKLRRLRRQTNTGATTIRYSGTVSGGDAAAGEGSVIANLPAGVTAALDLIYASEDNTMQGTLDVTSLSGLPAGIDVAAATSEAFDEPLSAAQVKAIVQGFFIPTIPG